MFRDPFFIIPFDHIGQGIFVLSAQPEMIFVGYLSMAVVVTFFFYILYACLCMAGRCPNCDKRGNHLEWVRLPTDEELPPRHERILAVVFAACVCDNCGNHVSMRPNGFTILPKT